MKKYNIDNKINFIIEQEKQHNNSWKWILKADKKTIDDLYEYWTQESGDEKKVNND